MYQAADTASPIFRPMYAVTPANTAPMAMPRSTFHSDQWETSNASARFFSSRYCSSSPVFRFLYISWSSQVSSPDSIALMPSAVTGRRYEERFTPLT